MPKKKPKKALEAALIKNAERTEALRRTPAFRRDCDQALEIYWRKHRGDFADDSIDPLGSKEVIISFLEESQEARDLAESWLLAETWHYLYPTPPLFKEFYVTQKVELIADRYLKITLDLDKTLEQVIAAVTQQYHRFSQQVRDKRRERTISYSGDGRMWQAFDLHKQGRKDLKIMWQIFPESKGKFSANDPEADKNLKDIKRWIRKAKKLIAEISCQKT